MLFSGIEVPPTFDLDSYSMEFLRLKAANHGESVDTYVEQSVGLVSIWGDNICKLELRAGILQGLADAETNVFDPIIIDALIDPEPVSKPSNPAIFSDYNVSLEDLKEVFSLYPFKIGRKHHDGLKTAGGYYDRPVIGLIRLALEVRDVVLCGQQNGLIYTFGDLDGNFYDSPIEAVPE